MLKVFSFLLFLFCFSSANAQTKAVVPIKRASVDADIAELSKLNKQFFQNFLNSDTVAHNKIVSKDFICIVGNGAVVNRVDYMKGWSHGYDPDFYKSYIQQNEFIRLFGNTALVRAETVCSYMENDREIFKTTVYTDTYLKLNGRWWCVQAQLTTKK
jgi:uncharacterized protein DUF4440